MNQDDTEVLRRDLDTSGLCHAVPALVKEKQGQNLSVTMPGQEWGPGFVSGGET